VAEQVPYRFVTRGRSDTGVLRHGHRIELAAYLGGSLVFLTTAVLVGGAAYTDFVNDARTLEATTAVGTMSKLQVEAYARRRQEAGGAALCRSSPHPVPERFSAVQNRNYTSSTADWQQGAPDEGFRCLGFEMTAAQYYQYDYASTGNQGRFTAWARGDLDGDGVTAELSQNGEVDLATRTVVLAKSLHRERPGE
jgi:hypothetical protein